jgi:hypothetical protein
VRGYEAAHPGASLLADGTFFRFLLDRAATVDGPQPPPRRSSVGTSNWQQIPFCIEAMLAVSPMRVLDVGIGFGRWGILVREFCEEWKGRTHRENWAVHLEGIEAYPRNVEEYHHLFYDWVHVGDAADIVGGMQERWGLVIFGDVLEHLEKDAATRLLDRALDLSDYALVNIPLGDGWERGEMDGNPWERHRSSWTLPELLERRPVRHALFREYNGRDYGAFLLSRSNPSSVTA